LLRRWLEPTLRSRCNAPVEAAPAFDIPLICGPQRNGVGANAAGSGPDRDRAAQPYDYTVWLLRIGRLPVRQALVPGRPVRPEPARRVPAHESADNFPLCRGLQPGTFPHAPAAGYGRIAAADILAQ